MRIRAGCRPFAARRGLQLGLYAYARMQSDSFQGAAHARPCDYALSAHAVEFEARTIPIVIRAQL